MPVRFTYRSVITEAARLISRCADGVNLILTAVGFSSATTNIQRYGRKQNKKYVGLAVEVVRERRLTTQLR